MKPRPNTLALELSSRHGSIAMMNKAGETAFYTTETGQRDQDSVMPSIEMASNELEVAPGAMELVIVSVGPGGFTGLRTSVAIAKMISYATRAKIVAVESAIVIANCAQRGNGPFLVISSVKQEECWLSRVERCGDTWNCVSTLMCSNELGLHVNGIAAVFGDEFVSSAARNTLQELNIPLLAIECNAKSLLEVGMSAAARGGFTDPLLLLPLYPREPEAVRIWNDRKSNG